MILLFQDEAPWTAGKIAEALALTTGAVTGLVDRLEKAGWVQRTRHGVDRRQVWIERTPARREELDAALAVQSAVLAEAAEPIDDATLERAVELIERAAHSLAEQAKAPADEPPPSEQPEGTITSAPIDGATRGTLRVASGVAHLELRAERDQRPFSRDLPRAARRSSGSKAATSTSRRAASACSAGAAASRRSC